MSNRPNHEAKTVRRIQVTRRPRRREVLPDTTLTDSWPPRLNTQL